MQRKRRNNKNDMPEQINPLSITTLSDTGKDILMVSPHLVEVTDSPIHTISTSIHAISTSATADEMSDIAAVRIMRYVNYTKMRYANLYN